MGIILTSSTNTIMKLFLLLSCLLGLVVSSAHPKDALLCTICTDIIGDIGNFITDDATEADILAVLEEACALLGVLIPSYPTIEAECKTIMEENLPTIIEGIINDNLDPTSICTMIGLCN